MCTLIVGFGAGFGSETCLAFPVLTQLLSLAMVGSPFPRRIFCFENKSSSFQRWDDVKQILEQSYQLSLVWISVSSWDHSFTVRPVLVAFPAAESPTSLSDQAGRSFDRSINLRSLFLVWISLSSWDQSFKNGLILYTLEPLRQF